MHALYQLSYYRTKDISHAKYQYNNRYAEDIQDKSSLPFPPPQLSHYLSTLLKLFSNK